MNIIGWILGRIGLMPARTETSIPRPKVGHGIGARCCGCGYEGDESEFLTDDPFDTACPRCGYDVVDYEM